MATSGTIAGSFSGSGSAGQKPYIFWERTSYSVANNTSTIKVTFKVKRIGTSYSTTKSGAPWTISIGDNDKTGTKDYKISSVGSGEYVTIGSYTKTVTHKSDGTLSVKLSAKITLSGTTAGTGTVSDTVTLPTIARVSTASLSASSVITGSKVTINISRKSSSFTHKVSYTLEGVSGAKTTGLSASSGIGTSCTFTPPHSLFQSLTTKASVKATITVTTMNGSTTVGSKTLTLTINLHADAKPVISGVTLTRVAGKSATADFGVYIQGLDKATVATTAAMNSGYASGGTVTITVSVEGKSYTGASVTSALLRGVGTVTITIMAKDSRGRSVSTTKDITVVAYSPPKVTDFKAFRAANSTATAEDPKGTYARVKGVWEYSDVSGKNTITAKLTIQKTGGSVTNISTAAAVNTWYTASNVSIAASYIVTLTVTDTVGNVASESITIMSGAKAMSFKSDGAGIAIGKYAEREGLEVDWDARFNNGFVVDDIDYVLDADTIALWTEILGGGVTLKGILAHLGQQRIAVPITYNTTNCSGIAYTCYAYPLLKTVKMNVRFTRKVTIADSNLYTSLTLGAVPAAYKPINFAHALATYLAIGGSAGQTAGAYIDTNGDIILRMTGVSNPTYFYLNGEWFYA